jgi:hypothetical protein
LELSVASSCRIYNSEMMAFPGLLKNDEKNLVRVCGGFDLP